MNFKSIIYIFAIIALCTLPTKPSNSDDMEGISQTCTTDLRFLEIIVKNQEKKEDEFDHLKDNGSILNQGITFITWS